MREINLQEVVQVSGGATAILDWTGYDATQWGTAWLGAGIGFGAGVAAGTKITATGLSVLGVELVGLTLGTVFAAAGGAAGYALGKVFTNQVLTRVDGLV